MADQYFSKITLPTGGTFLVKDSGAREAIEALKKATAGGVSYLGTTTTELVDGATTSPIDIKNGDKTTSVEAVTGGMVNYNNIMYAWNGDQWDQLGSAGALKALAYKDSVSGTYTPEGSVSGTSVVVDLEKVSIQSVTSVGTLPSYTDATYTYDADNETLTIGAAVFNAGTLPTQGEAVNVATNISKVTVTDPTFTGTQATIESK